MMDLKTRLCISLLVLVGTAPPARPQAAPSGPAASQEIVRKSGKPGNSSGSPARKSIAEASPGLCFQPGVGWQRSPTEKHNGSVVSGAKQTHSFECSGILTDKGESGAGAGTT